MGNDKTSNLSVLDSISKFKGKWLLICGVVLGILLIIGGAFLKPESKKSSNNSTQKQVISTYTETLEARIKSICDSISGISNSKVLLTLDSGSEYIFAQNQSQSSGTQSKEYLLIKDGGNDETVLVKEIFPKIRGIAIVCTGGDNPSSQSKIVQVLSTALGIASNRICVAGGTE